MKNVILILAMFSIVQTVQAKSVRIKAEFFGESPKTNIQYEIGQFEGSEAWLVKQVTPCQSYPCDNKGRTKTLKIYPNMTSNETSVDGGAVIELGKYFRLTYYNNGLVPPNADGTRVDSYWTLGIKDKNSNITEEFKMYLQAFLK